MSTRDAPDQLRGIGRSMRCSLVLHLCLEPRRFAYALATRRLPLHFRRRDTVDGERGGLRVLFRREIEPVVAVKERRLEVLADVVYFERLKGR